MIFTDSETNEIRRHFYDVFYQLNKVHFPLIQNILYIVKTK